MKKKTIAILGGIAAAVLFAAAVAGLWSVRTNYATVLRVNWGFSMPLRVGRSHVYVADTGPSFHGDGIRYHVFSYKREEPIEAMLTWAEKEGTTRHYASYRKAAETWLDELDVPVEFRPDYDNCVYWYEIQSGNCEIIVFWDKAADTLATLEFLM